MNEEARKAFPSEEALAAWQRYRDDYPKATSEANVFFHGWRGGAKAEREAIVRFIRDVPDGTGPAWPALMRFIEAMANDIEAGAHHKQEAKT